MHLKLSGVLFLQKVTQMVITPGYRQLGPRPGDNQTYLKAAGEKFHSSPWGCDNAPCQQKEVTETGPSPLSAPQEWGAEQKTEEGFVTSKAH